MLVVWSQLSAKQRGGQNLRVLVTTSPLFNFFKPEEPYRKFLLRVRSGSKTLAKASGAVHCVYFVSQFLSVSVTKSQPLLTQVSEPKAAAVVHAKPQRKRNR